MEKGQVWDKYKDEIFFFILKKTGNNNAAKDISQSVFLKVHCHYNVLRNKQKLRSWVFQIARNEIIDYYKNETRYVEIQNEEKRNFVEAYDDVCCLNFFMNSLPSPYKEAIHLVYV